MAEINQTSNIELIKKRGIKEVSSTSELDSSINTPPTKKKNKKKSKKVDEEELPDMSGLQKELNQINKKLSNVLTKDDGSLRDMIRDMIQQMKDELLKSVDKKLDILESKLFEKEQENDKLKTEIVNLNKTINSQKEENEKMQHMIDRNEKKTAEHLNNLEQYSRSNNIRINGMEEVQNENAYQTTKLVVNKLNEIIPEIALKTHDIDISHRMGPKKTNKNRQIIVKFTSRLSKSIVMSNLKKFKGTKLFISEDLTNLNQSAYLCVKNKMKDDVNAVWTRNGNIYYENKAGNTYHVKFSEYQDWFELPWPKENIQNRRK